MARSRGILGTYVATNSEFLPSPLPLGVIYHLYEDLPVKFRIFSKLLASCCRSPTIFAGCPSFLPGSGTRLFAIPSGGMQGTGRLLPSLAMSSPRRIQIPRAFWLVLGVDRGNSSVPTRLLFHRAIVSRKTRSGLRDGRSESLSCFECLRVFLNLQGNFSFARLG